MNCGYKLQMISMLLYLSILGEMCKHGDVVRAIGSVTYTYTMNRWGKKCYIQGTYCKERTVQGTYCTLYKTTLLFPLFFKRITYTKKKYTEIKTKQL